MRRFFPDSLSVRITNPHARDDPKVLAIQTRKAAGAEGVRRSARDAKALRHGSDADSPPAGCRCRDPAGSEWQIGDTGTTPVAAGAAGADVSGSITTGIFVRICSEAAEEDFRNGRKRVTPYWRVVRDDGTLIDTFPGGSKAQAKRFADEGIEIEPGKRGQPRVTELGRRLVRWPT